MKFPESWLHSFVPYPQSSQELAHLLTMAGLEVEAIEPIRPTFEGVVVAEVLGVAKHPHADKLTVCSVNAGEGKRLQIVCGAINVAVGRKFPLALPGAELPGGVSIAPTEVRGIESQGMLCSASELGISSASSGLLELDENAPIGRDLAQYLNLNDTVLTLKLTPNRGDCLSVVGIAREVAAITSLAWQAPAGTTVPVHGQDQRLISIVDAKACPRYCGRIIHNLRRDAKTPDWMAQRLMLSGLRPSDPVVDVTNYVMLELGQPLHAFDLAKIGKEITVRYARGGETLTLLNQQTVNLDARTLVIADETNILAIAGVMGGLSSAVGDTSTSVFLESAFFSPEVIQGQARQLGITSEAAHRFERGVDFQGVRWALERATGLLQEICGGEVQEMAEVIATPPPRPAIRLRTARAARILGIALDSADIQALLTRLNCAVRVVDDDALVTPPSYRFDLEQEVDLIEELARLHGYEQIPSLTPVAALTPSCEPEDARSPMQLRLLLNARDYQETISYSFGNHQQEQALAGDITPIRLQNPLASHINVMRTTLFGGLLETLSNNLKKQQDRVRIYEIGRCFYSLEEQPEMIAGLCYGLITPEQWGSPARDVDFFDVKGDIEALCLPNQLRFEAKQHPALRPGETARLWLEGEQLGWLGRLHPKLQQEYGLSHAPILFELKLALLLARKLPVFQELVKFPMVRRDLAVEVDNEISVQEILENLRKTAPDIVLDLVLFDIYRGKGIDSDKKSLAFKVLLQDTQATLTEKTIERVIADLIHVLETRFAAKLRN